ncbi:hypothetical protein BH24ACT5_BH24ACT5_06350 [soil metagenome]
MSEPQSVRNLTVLTRRAGISRADFRRHWLDVHAPMVAELPHVLSYSQHHVESSTTRSGFATRDYEIDGFVDFRFDSADGMQKAFESDLGRSIMSDAQQFIESMRVYTVTEHPIVG